MNDDDLEIQVIPELTQFAQGMQQLPAIGDKASRKMADEIGKNTKKAEKAAADSAKASAAAYQSNFQKISGAAANMAGGVGGSFGKIGSLANGALKPILEVGAALGPAGLAAALGPAGLAGAIGVGLVGAVALGAAGLVQLGAAAGEAGARLQNTGALTTEQAIAARDLKIANDGLAIATDALTVKLAAALPITKDLTNAYTGMKLKVAELATATGEVGDANDEVSTGVGLLASKFPLLALAYHATVDEMASDGERFAQTQAALTEALAEEQRRRESGFRGETQVIHKELELRKVFAEQSAEDSARIREELLENLVTLEERELAASAASRDELLANNERVLDSRRGYHDRYLSMLQSEGAALQAQTDLERQEAQIRMEVWAGLVDSQLQAAQTITDAVVSGYERRLNSGEKMGRRERNQMEESASRAYALSQSLAATQVIISAAITGAGVAANLATVMGPFALVAGGAAAASVLTTGLVAIASAPPPEFPMGGMFGGTPDHRPVVRMRDDEGAVTGRGVSALGGPDGLDDLNLGRIPGGDVHVTLVLDREVIGAAVAKVSGGSANGVIRASRGRRTVYGGGGY